MNICSFNGRLAATPELKATTTGVPVLAFDIAVRRKRKDADGEYGADFIRCVAWQNDAENISKYFSKGQMIIIVGRYGIRKYEDRKGHKKEAHEITVEEWDFCGASRENPSEAWWVEERQRRERAASSEGMSQGYSTAGSADFEEIVCDDIDGSWPTAEQARAKPAEGTQLSMRDIAGGQGPGPTSNHYINSAIKTQQQREKEFAAMTDIDLAKHWFKADEEGRRADRAMAVAEIMRRKPEIKHPAEFYSAVAGGNGNG